MRTKGLFIGTKMTWSPRWVSCPSLLGPQACLVSKLIKKMLNLNSIWAMWLWNINLSKKQLHLVNLPAKVNIPKFMMNLVEIRKTSKFNNKFYGNILHIILSKFNCKNQSNRFVLGKSSDFRNTTRQKNRLIGDCTPYL